MQALRVLPSYLTPTFLGEQVRKGAKKVSDVLDIPYLGIESYRYQGPGDAYLKSRQCFTSDNIWEVSRTVLCLSTIAFVGYLIASFSPLIGMAIVAGAGFPLLSTLNNYRQGNHLEKAFHLMLSGTEGDAGPFSILTINDLKTWELDLQNSQVALVPEGFVSGKGKEKERAIKPWHVRKIVDPKTKEIIGIAFKSVDHAEIQAGKTTIRAYVFKHPLELKFPFLAKLPPKIDQERLKFVCKKRLEGKEIASLLEIIGEEKAERSRLQKEEEDKLKEERLKKCRERLEAPAKETETRMQKRYRKQADQMVLEE
jgi:hypothetical protein